MKLFGTDGVRGEAGTFLTASLAMKVAMAAGIYFKDSANYLSILVYYILNAEFSSAMIFNDGL